MRRHEHSEAGFTVIEGVVAMGIMAMALATIFGSLDVFTRRTAQTQERSVMLSETRSAVEIITRDLRAANPIDQVTPVNKYDSDVRFSVYCASAGAGTCGTSNLRAVRYRVENYQLQQLIGSTAKVLLGPLGSAGVVTSRQGAIVNSSSQPVFKYFRKDGTQLVTSGTDAVPASSFQNCAQYVEIHLVVVAEPGKPTSTINLVTRADLRNYNQVTGC
jgi:type II secretory pathway pseudopilin PulG